MGRGWQAVWVMAKIFLSNLHRLLMNKCWKFQEGILIFVCVIAKWIKIGCNQWTPYAQHFQSIHQYSLKVQRVSMNIRGYVKGVKVPSNHFILWWFLIEQIDRAWAFDLTTGFNKKVHTISSVLCYLHGSMYQTISSILWQKAQLYLIEMTTYWLFLFSPLLEKNKSLNCSQDTRPPLGCKRRLIHSIPINPILHGLLDIR